MVYTGLKLESSISIDMLYSVHYFECMRDFSFEGETHNFWELVCVDKGTVDIYYGTHVTTLKKDEIFFHEPNEFHNVRGNGDSVPNLLIISFSCQSPVMDFFRKKKLKINEIERSFLANILSEARNCFDCRLDINYQLDIPLKTEEHFGAQQLLRMYLEQFFIYLYRRFGSDRAKYMQTDIEAGGQSDSIIFGRVVEYMEMNLTSRLTIDQICRDNLLGRSKLQKIFRERCGVGPIEYFLYLKIRAAKEMIRTGNMNFTQIADALGYSSIHYFSRQFKKISGMTLSEYANSIKEMAEKKG